MFVLALLPNTDATEAVVDEDNDGDDVERESAADSEFDGNAVSNNQTFTASGPYRSR